MRHTINVSQAGEHLFRAELPESSSVATALSIAKDMRKRYPITQRFEVELTQWSSSYGRTLDLEDKPEPEPDLRPSLTCHHVSKNDLGYVMRCRVQLPYDHQGPCPSCGGPREEIYL